MGRLSSHLRHGLAVLYRFGWSSLEAWRCGRYSTVLLTLLAPLLLGADTFNPEGDSLSEPLHYCLAVVVFLILSASLEVSATVGSVGTLVYLVLLGSFRRGLIPYTGYMNNDPITLVSTAVSLTIFLKLTFQRQIILDTRIAKLARALLIWMFLEVFNPAQGGLLVGLGGIIFYMTPLFWFFIGRHYGSQDTIQKLLKALVWVATGVAAVGLYQTLFGFSEVEQYWMKISAGAAQPLSARANRVFATFLSFSEYVHVMMIGFILSWVFVLRRRYVYILPLIFLFVMLFLSSSRGAVFGILFASVVVWAVQGKDYRLWIPRLLFAAVIATAGLMFGIDQVKEVQFSERTDEFIQHQVRGISDPLGEQSTGSSHLTLFWRGIQDGISQPLGYGLGASTLAGGKFGDKTVGSTEIDLSNLCVSLGIGGGVLYLVLCVLICRAVAVYWHESRDATAVFVIGLMAVEYGQWLSGAHYAAVMGIWIIFGIIDKLVGSYSRKPAAPLTVRRAT